MIISHSSNLLLGATASAACRDGVLNDTRMLAYQHLGVYDSRSATEMRN